MDEECTRGMEADYRETGSDLVLVYLGKAKSVISLSFFLFALNNIWFERVRSYLDIRNALNTFQPKKIDKNQNKSHHALLYINRVYG